MTRSIVIASGVRTVIGDFGGALAGISPCDPGAVVTRDVPPHAVVAGVPAVIIGTRQELNNRAAGCADKQVTS